MIVEEPGSDLLTERTAVADGLVTSRLAYVEAWSALARMRVGGRLSAGQHRDKVLGLDAGWTDMSKLEVDAALVDAAALLADRHGLRAYDAVHLASAIEAEPDRRTVFACFDRELRGAAEGEGLACFPLEA